MVTVHPAWDIVMMAIHSNGHSISIGDNNMKLTITITDENGNNLNSLFIDSTLDKIDKALKDLDETKPEMPKFEMTYVGNRSSNVESVGWLNESLYVKFQRNNTLYRYDGVERAVYDEALKADSIGKYLVANVKDKYKVTKVN